MKKTLTVTTLALLAGAVSAYSQQVSMGDGLDSGGSFGIQVFKAQASSSVPVSYGGYSGLETMGSSGDSASGYATSGGSAVYTGGVVGSGYEVELLAAPGSGDALSTLLPVAGSSSTSWYAGTGASDFGGFWDDTALPTIPNATVGGSATVAIAVFSTTYSSLAAAEASGVSGTWGISSAQTVSDLGGGLVQPPTLPTTISSFSLATTATPEPSTIALGVIGVSSLLFRRRK